MLLQRDIQLGIGLGIGTLLLFLGYFAHCFIAESVIYSRYVNYGDIEKFGGYYGQAIQMFSFAVMNLFAPTVVALFSAKRSIQFTGVCFGVFFLGFTWFNKWFFYISQVICGVGYAVFNVAEGVYIAEHTNAESLEWVTSVETAISHGGQLVAGLLLGMVQIIGTLFPVTIGITGYSEMQTTVTYLLFLATVLLGVAAFQPLPSKAESHSIVGKHSAEFRGFWKEMRSVASVVRTREIAIVIPLSCYQGFFTTFFLSVYPTYFNFGLQVVNVNYYVWGYCSLIGIGVLVGGAILAIGSQFQKQFTLYVSMVLHALVIITTCGIISFTTPMWAFVEPQKKLPGLPCILVVAFLVGIGDCCITTFRSVVCQKLWPDKRMEIFSLTRIIQAISSGLALIWSPHLTTNAWMILLTVLLNLTMISVFIIIRSLKPDELEGSRRPIMEDGSRCLFDNPAMVVDHPVFVTSPRRPGMTRPVTSLPQVKSSARVNEYRNAHILCRCAHRQDIGRQRSHSVPDGYMEICPNPVSIIDPPIYANDVVPLLPPIRVNTVVTGSPIYENVPASFV